VDETVRARFHAEAAVHPEASVRELERLLDGLDPFLTDDEKARLAALDAFRELKLGSARDSWWIQEAADFAVVLTPQALDLRLSWPGGLLALEKSAGEFDAFLVGDAEVTTRLFEELPLVAFRLDAEQRDLFLEASRMKGEVEFRHTLAIPIPIAASVLAFGLGSPLWVWITATVAGIVGGWGLLADGWRRDALRNDYLVELLAIGKATSPTFERLLERARGTPARGPGAPLDEAVASAVLTDAHQEPPEVVAGASRGHTQDPEKVRRPAASHAPGSASKPRRAVED
jgi:hypothetical protein